MDGVTVSQSAIRRGLSQGSAWRCCCCLRQRMRGAHIRNRLVPVTPTGDWFVRGIIGDVVGCFYGRIVRGQCRLSAFPIPRAASVARLCAAGTRDRFSGDRSFVSGALCGTDLCLARWPGSARLSVPWIDLRGLFISRYRANGRDTAGARPVCGHQPSRSVVARPVLRGKHSRSSFWLLVGRVLSVANPRYAHGSLRCRGAQRDHGCKRLFAFRALAECLWMVERVCSWRGRAGFGTSDGALSAKAIQLQRPFPPIDYRGIRPPGALFPGREQDWSISRSPCQDYARLAPKWSGQGCCH